MGFNSGFKGLITFQKASNCPLLTTHSVRRRVTAFSKCKYYLQPHVTKTDKAVSNSDIQMDRQLASRFACVKTLPVATGFLSPRHGASFGLG